MFLARLLDGASGGNILVAQAYVADVTKPEERSRGYGLIGMAFGLGFVLGPLLGLLMLQVPVADGWRLRLPFLAAAGFSTLAWVLVLLWLPESLPKDVRDRRSARVVSRRGLVDALRLPGVGAMICLASLVVLGFSSLEGTFGLYLEKRQRWDPGEILAGFTFLGLVTAMVQGGMVRRLVPRFGEGPLAIAGLIFLVIGFAGLIVAGGTTGVLMATAAVGIGQGLASPTITGLLSRITPEAEQGGSIRRALLGPDVGQDGELSGREPLVRSGGRRRSVSRGRRDRPGRAGPGDRGLAQGPGVGRVEGSHREGRDSTTGDGRALNDPSLRPAGRRPS